MVLLKHIPLIGVHILIYGAVWGLAGPVIGWGPRVFGALLIWVSCRDIAVFEVPDVAAALLVITGIVLASDMLWALGSALLWAARFLGVQQGARVWMGHEALGLGDVKLMGGLAAGLGPVAPIYVTLYASVAAIAALIALTLNRGVKLDEIALTGIAFGPFLCLCAWGIWLWGFGS